MKRNVIILIAALMAGTAFYVFTPEQIRYWMYILGDAAGGQNPFADKPAGTLLLTICFDAILLGKLLAAIGLLFRTAWAWHLSMLALSCDVAQRVVGIIHFLGAEEPECIPELDEAFTITISMYPTYIITAISLGSLIVLVLRPIRHSLLETQASRREHLLGNEHSAQRNKD